MLFMTRNSPLGMRISSVMVVEQARGQQQNSAQFQPIGSSQTMPEHQGMAEQAQQQPVQNKVKTRLSSPSAKKTRKLQRYKQFFMLLPFQHAIIKRFIMFN